MYFKLNLLYARKKTAEEMVVHCIIKQNFYWKSEKLHLDGGSLWEKWVCKSAWMIVCVCVWLKAVFSCTIHRKPGCHHTRQEQRDLKWGRKRESVEVGESWHQGAKEGELTAQWRNKREERERDSGRAVDDGSRWKHSRSFVTILFFSVAYK